MKWDSVHTNLDCDVLHSYFRASIMMMKSIDFLICGVLLSNNNAFKYILLICQVLETYPERIHHF